MVIIEDIMNCLQSEKDFRDRYYEFVANKESVWVDILKNWERIKQERLLTKAFLRRIYLAYESEALFNQKIGRKWQRSISSDIENFFGQMLRAFLKSQNVKNFRVEINTKLGVRQPDILIKKDDKPECVIELKSDLGYSRKQWHEIMNGRLSAYKQLIEENNFFVVVLTVANWMTNKMKLEDELKKWNGKKGNFVFLIKDPKIHPNLIKLPNGGIKEEKVFASLNSLDRIVSKPALEEVFDRILSTMRS